MPIILTGAGGGGAGGAVVAAGDVAAGVADSGNPVKVGGVGSSSAPAAVATGQRANAWFSVNGAHVVSHQTAALGSGDGNGNAFITPATPGNAIIEQTVRQNLFNGATWDRVRSASAANLAALSGIGASLAAPPGQWAVFAAPAANTIATATRTAGGAGVRHVCTAVNFAVRGGAVAPAAVQLTVNLRDGATGAGTVLATWTLVLAAAVGAKDEVTISGLNLVGSAATAMTLEFTAVGGANTFENVFLAGFDCQ